MNTSDLPEMSCIQPQMKKTLVLWQKKKRTKAQIDRRARTLATATRMVLARNGTFDIVDKLSNRPTHSSAASPAFATKAPFIHDGNIQMDKLKLLMH